MLRTLGGQPISSLVKKGDVVDKSEAYQFIKLLLIDLCDYYTVSWSECQLTETAKNIYALCYFMTEFDWRAFVVKIESGHFGKIYGNAAKDYSPAYLMECVNQFRDEWIEVSENLAIEKHTQIKNEEKNATLDDKNYAYILANKKRVDKIEHEEMPTGERLWEPDNLTPTTQ